MIFQDKIIRLHELTRIVGISSSTLWRREQEGTFPKRRQLGVRSVGWLASEINEWIENREIKKKPEVQK